MIPISLNEIINFIDGSLLNKKKENLENLMIKEIIIDSRIKSKDSLFISLIGDKFDGHNFVSEAISNGSVAILVSRPLKIFNYSCKQIIVQDTRVAMRKIALLLRIKSNAKVIAITGSCGKTSVKEILVSIMSSNKFVLYTNQNFNNDIGISLTLFRLEKSHKYIIIEIGISKIGEIDYISNIVRPEIALVNNLFISHLKGFKSFEMIKFSKGRIFSYLSTFGTAIMNFSSCNFNSWKNYFNNTQTILFFSLYKSERVDFYVRKISHYFLFSTFELCTPIGSIFIKMNLLGEHNIMNMLAASTIAVSSGIKLEQIKLGLEKINPIPGRLFPIYLSYPKKILLDDSYNSNIGSIMTGSRVLNKFFGYKVFIIGDMNDLGEKSIFFHKRASFIICQMKFDQILSFGNKSIFFSKNHFNGLHFDLSSREKLLNYIYFLIEKYSEIVLLIKGSRNMKMEKLVNKIKKRFILC